MKALREKRVEYLTSDGTWRKSGMNEQASGYFLSLPVGTHITIVFPSMSGKKRHYRIS